MPEPRRVAVLGAGIGSAHVAGYLELPERFTVHTVCDRDAARAAAPAAQAGCAVVADIEAVLADPAVEIVDVSLPPHLHLPVCLAALDAGKHVICEKPLTGSLADADRIVERAAATGLQVFPVFQYRYGPGAAQLRALIDAGLAGRPLVGTLETHWNRQASYYDVDWRGTWAGEQGGAILGHAIHIHDWLSMAMGPVASVVAEVDTRVNDIEIEDCAALAIRMASGALVTSSVTLGAADDTSRLRLCFEGFTAESGSVPYAPADGVWRFTAREPFEQAAIDRVLAGVPRPRSGFAGLFEAVADALDGRPGREVTLDDGWRSLAFVTAVYASARSGRRETLPQTADHPLYASWLP
jgi:predicted dehydrogenase